jgi:hypothetical protein
VPASVKPSASQTITLANIGASPLTVTSISSPGCAAANFSVASPGTPQALNTCDIFPVIATYNGKIAAGSDSCTVTITTTAGSKVLTLLGTSQ